MNIYYSYGTLYGKQISKCPSTRRFSLCLGRTNSGTKIGRTGSCTISSNDNRTVSITHNITAKLHIF